MPAVQAPCFLGTLHLRGAHTVEDATQWFWDAADALQRLTEVRGAARMPAGRWGSTGGGTD